MVRLRSMFPVLVPVFALAMVGCSGTPSDSAPSSSGSSVSVASAASVPSATSTTSSAVPTSAGTKLEVTVPGLGGAAPESSVATSALPTSAVATSAEVAPATDLEDGAPSAASPMAPTSPSSTAPDTVEVQLVGCDDCEVLGTHANVVAGYSAALISQGGRAAVISVDPAGALVGIMAVPYGVTFATQPDGRLACGAGGRCLVVAAQSDGRVILSAFALGADGKWTDLSGSGGFVSATTKGFAVALEDALGAAVQVTDGTTTVWNVLAWNGSAFATLGCSPDGDTPDLASLDLALCLS